MKIVAEIGINHNGSLDLAKKLIVMARAAGCDYVKFQKRDIWTVYRKEFLNSPRDSPWGMTQLDQKKGLEFSPDQWKEIDEFCKVERIGWFASCWDARSLAFIDSFNPPLNKIASPMLTNIPFLVNVASKGRLTLISTGMSTMEEVKNAVKVFEEWSVPYVLLHAVSEYPTADEVINLRGMLELRRELGGGKHFRGVGYSNHSSGIESVVGAAYLGAEWIEAHITLDRAMYGSDQAASIERRGLEQLVKYCRNAKIILGDGVKRVTPKERENAIKMRYWE